MASSAAAKLNRIARRTQPIPRRVVNEAVRSIQRSRRAALAEDTGGDFSLSGAPGPMTVKRSVRGQTIVTGKVSAAGSRGAAGRWSWLEHGTQPHRIGRWLHPGTEAKQTWTRGLDSELDRVRRDTERAFREAVH